MWTMKPRPNRLIAGQAPVTRTTKMPAKDREDHPHDGCNKSQVDSVAPVAALSRLLLGPRRQDIGSCSCHKTPESRELRGRKQSI